MLQVTDLIRKDFNDGFLNGSEFTFDVKDENGVVSETVSICFGQVMNDDLFEVNIYDGYYTDYLCAEFSTLSDARIFATSKARAIYANVQKSVERHNKALLKARNVCN